MATPHIPTPEERRQERLEERESKRPNAIMGTIFGIIMIIIYVGMGVLLIINYFNWGADWAWTRYVVGIVLIIYGLFRAYREYKGIGKY